MYRHTVWIMLVVCLPSADANTLDSSRANVRLIYVYADSRFKSYGQKTVLVN